MKTTNKGVITARELLPKEFIENISVLKYNKKDNTFIIGKLMYLNPKGEYMFESISYKGYLKEHEIPVLVEIQDLKEELGVSLISPTQWNKLIRKNLINTGHIVDYKVVAPVFFEGDFNKSCGDCMSYFKGAKRQSFCEQCNINRGLAHVNIPDIKEIEDDTVTLKIRLKELKEKAALKLAFQAGVSRTCEFDTWYNETH